jgi:hypothetical protein
MRFIQALALPVFIKDPFFARTALKSRIGQPGAGSEAPLPQTHALASLPRLSQSNIIDTNMTTVKLTAMERAL